MIKSFGILSGIVGLALMASCSNSFDSNRKVTSFNEDWYFAFRDTTAQSEEWRTISLPHDWSIEGPFDPSYPAGVGGGALPGGLGIYKKEFTLDRSHKGKKVFIQFDGVYQNSGVWINDHLLGHRPNGYISFEYDLTPYLFFGDSANLLKVEVDNSLQPNSRWYSGSGIYRDVRLVTTDQIYIPQYGTYITTASITARSADVNLQIRVRNDSDSDEEVTFISVILSPDGVEVGRESVTQIIQTGDQKVVDRKMTLRKPVLWTLEKPQLYTLVSELKCEGKLVDRYETPFGIRSFSFDVDQGFSLNGVHTKIKGVCLHHDLGCLGSAFNTRAMERELQIMKEMGVNAIRTSHNPPAPAVLDLCDKMGLLVMDEMFDMWRISKTRYDYSMYWDEWHERDLRDFILRDRNHPSIVVWSIGNEIMEQYDHSDTTGGIIAQELAKIVRELDLTRPVTAANNDTGPENPLIKYGGLDIIGFNYHHDEFEQFQERFPGQKFIATETNSGLSTRGYYDMPSDSVRIWPIAWDKPFNAGNPDNTVSAYDHVRPPWGSTQEDTWSIVKNNDFISGMFIWTGFDYLGEPTPYGWPSRSSYFGLVDLAGFPKDTYFMYKSEWSEDTVLHIFPHWNWEEGQAIDIWAYYNYADEVELYLNDESLGIKRKSNDEFHTIWKVHFSPGTLKAVSRKNGQEIKTKVIQTAGKPSRIVLEADRGIIKTSGDLSFITVKVLDKDGNIVPYADNLITFEVEGEGELAGVDNGDPVSHASFRANSRQAFHGLCLAVIRSMNAEGSVLVKATGEGLEGSSLEISIKK